MFNLAIPKALEGVESTLLNPINTWLDKNAYAETRDKLAHMFVQNSNAMKMSKKVLNLAIWTKNLRYLNEK